MFRTKTQNQKKLKRVDEIIFGDANTDNTLEPFSTADILSLNYAQKI